MDLYNITNDDNNYDKCIILEKELDKYKLKVQELQTCIDNLSVENNKLKKEIEDYKSTVIYTKEEDDDEDDEDEDEEDDEDEDEEDDEKDEDEEDDEEDEEDDEDDEEDEDEEDDEEDEDDEEEDEDDEDDDGYNTEDENATEEEYSPKKLSKRNKEECIIC